jgi:hypothetical protein
VEELALGAATPVVVPLVLESLLLICKQCLSTKWLATNL